MVAVWAVRPVDVVYDRRVIACLKYSEEKEEKVAVVTLSLKDRGDMLAVEDFLSLIGARSVLWNEAQGEFTFETAIPVDGRRREILYSIARLFQDHLAAFTISVHCA